MNWHNKIYVAVLTTGLVGISISKINKTENKLLSKNWMLSFFTLVLTNLVYVCVYILYMFQK